MLTARGALELPRSEFCAELFELPLPLRLELRADPCNELRAELAATEGQGISRERERLHSAVEHAQEQQHAEELSHAGVSPELAAEYEAARIRLDRP